jgi:hypothetical protein
MNMMYDHFIAVDWAQRNMAIARMTRHSHEAQVIDVPSDIGDLRLYLRQLQGKKILTFEEMNAAQWLYTELREEVDEIVVCDPYRNHLLKEGAKNDKIDARKLALLLRAGLLKPVFHTSDSFIEIRKLLTGYQHVVSSGVRMKNQRAAMFRARGMPQTEEKLPLSSEMFVLEGLDRGIAEYEEEKLRYEKEFKAIHRKNSFVRLIESIPGIGVIGAVKVAAIVVDPRRFPDRSHFLSYCGLIRHQKMSGGMSYGFRRARSCLILKTVFKTAAINCTMARCSGSENPFRSYYHDLIDKRGYAEHNARHAVARRIAVVTYGVMKSQTKFKDFWRDERNQDS